MSASRPRWLLDTNILLRLSNRGDPQHEGIRAALKRLMLKERAQCFYTLQNLTELWNVCTRPAERNGYGFSIADADARLKLIERLFVLLPDTRGVCDAWRSLVRTHAVSGVQVYDARLAATCRVYRIPYILTLNGQDFKRYPGVTAISPADV